MSYLIDRAEAFRDQEIVAILAGTPRQARSRVLLRDGSLRYSRSRPAALRRRLQARNGGLKEGAWFGGSGPRTPGR